MNTPKPWIRIITKIFEVFSFSGSMFALYHGAYLPAIMFVLAAIYFKLDYLFDR